MVTVFSTAVCSGNSPWVIPFFPFQFHLSKYLNDGTELFHVYKGCIVNNSYAEEKEVVNSAPLPPPLVYIPVTS